MKVQGSVAFIAHADRDHGVGFIDSLKDVGASKIHEGTRRRNDVPGAPDLHEVVIERLFEVASRLHLRLSRQYAPFGLTVEQVRLLQAVAEQPGLPQVDYGRLLDMNEVAISQRVRHLTAAGLIVKHADPDNRRVRLLYRSDVNPGLDARLERRQAFVLAHAILEIPAGARNQAIAAASRLYDTMGDWDMRPARANPKPFQDRPRARTK